jgi:hypothetical protein
LVSQPGIEHWVVTGEEAKSVNASLWKRKKDGMGEGGSGSKWQKSIDQWVVTGPGAFSPPSPHRLPRGQKTIVSFFKPAPFLG